MMIAQKIKKPTPLFWQVAGMVVSVLSLWGLVFHLSGNDMDMGILLANNAALALAVILIVRLYRKKKRAQKGRMP